MLAYLVQFLLFGVVGWGIDSAYSSWQKKRWLASGYFRGVPFCAIYGFGGILLVNSFKLLSGWPFEVVVPATTVLVVGLEYVGGYLAERFLGEKLWDYSKEFFNLGGYISAYHSFLWLILVAVVYGVGGKWLVRGAVFLEKRLVLPTPVNVLLTFGVVMGGLRLTLENKKRRLGKGRE